jgi:hypothetical protein
VPDAVEGCEQAVEVREQMLERVEVAGAAQGEQRVLDAGEALGKRLLLGRQRVVLGGGVQAVMLAHGRRSAGARRRSARFRRFCGYWMRKSKKL